MSFFQELSVYEQALFCSYIAVAGLVLIGLVVFGILLSRISSGKFVKSCKKISDFANEAGTIDDANLEQFEATCLDEQTNHVFLEGWEAFKTARFGYPSEYVDKENVLSAFNAKKFKLSVLIYSVVLFVISVVIAIFAILTTRDYQYCLLFAILAMVLPLIILAAYLPVRPVKKASAAYEQMSDDFDTAVKLQRLVERKVDNSRLMQIQDVIKDVILAEQSKPIPSKKDQLAKQNAVDKFFEEESVDDIRGELFDDEEEPVVEIPELVVPITEVEEPVYEEAVVEAEPEPEPEPVEVAPAPKKPIPFEPFVGVLDSAIESGKYPKETLKKMANILVLAFGKFKEPEQREALKNSIRKFLVAYKAAVAAERAEEEGYAEEEYVEEEVAAEEEYAEEEVATEEEYVEEEAAPVEEIEVPQGYSPEIEESLADEIPSYVDFAPQTPSVNKVDLDVPEIIAAEDDLPELPD